VVCVAPETHRVVSERLPSTVPYVSTGPADQLVAACAGVDGLETVYPLDALRSEPAELPTASPVDTHWTDWGAYVAYRQVLAAAPGRPWSRPIPADGLRLVRTRVPGDLGPLLDPVREGEMLEVAFPRPLACRIKDNRVARGGRRIRFHTAGANKARCLLFGASSVRRVLKFFVATFRDVLWCNVGRLGYDEAFVESFRPDVVISLVKERYLIQDPPVTTTLAEVGRDSARVSARSARRLYDDWTAPRAS